MEENNKLPDAFEVEYNSETKGAIKKHLRPNSIPEINHVIELCIDKSVGMYFMFEKGIITGYGPRQTNLPLITTEQFLAAYGEKKPTENRKYFEGKQYQGYADLANYPGNWIEDFEQENGNYENECGVCFNSFLGNKHRRICKNCDNELRNENTEQSETSKAYREYMKKTQSLIDASAANNELYREANKDKEPVSPDPFKTTSIDHLAQASLYNIELEKAIAAKTVTLEVVQLILKHINEMPDEMIVTKKELQKVIDKIFGGLGK